MANMVLILGNQLFSMQHLKQNLQHIKDEKNFIFMREDFELCTYYRFHKHKIIFFLAAMRGYRDELQQQLSNYEIHYEILSKKKFTYEESLLQFIVKNKIKKVFFYEIEDKFFETRIKNCLLQHKICYEIWSSPMFLTPRDRFQQYLQKNKKPFMKTFYEQQRKSLHILVDSKQKPIGGQWSFDSENRLALPPSLQPPSLPIISASQHVLDVQKIVAEYFANHPGSVDNFWLPVDRQGAKDWLKDFLKNKLAEFGPYEDALSRHSDFVFHSVLTPFLNTGLLTPQEVVEWTLKHAEKAKVPIASLEGFLRQIIGWREFIRGIYQNFSDQQSSSNFFQHQKRLTQHWYEGTTGILPLDHAIRKTQRWSYCHHIERLMVVGSLMLLLEVHPQEAHRWFMEMFIDSSDWVMGPNVYGMALFSDGGIFATKPYFCGSNYYRKMGGYKKQDLLGWSDAVDGLYWGFIEKHKNFFLKNPRLSMMVRTVEKMDAVKKNKIFQAADELKNKITK